MATRGNTTDSACDEHTALMRQWVPVIGRSLAYLSLHASETKDRNLAEKATFLEALGIERREVAPMLGTPYGSITETLSKMKRTRKGGKTSGRKAGRKARE